MTGDPLITVLMAVYNDEKYIVRAVRSILDQTFKAFDMIIIDDGSRDKSVEFIQQLNDSRIHIECNPTNLGLTRSLNRGLALSRGRFIARMDADDFAYPTRLQKQFDFLNHNPEYGLVGSWFHKIDENGILLSEVQTPETNGEIQAALRKGNTFAHSAVMFPRRYCYRVGNYREFFKYAQDYDLFLRLASEFPVYNIPEVLVDLRIHMDSTSVRLRVLQDCYADLARHCAYSGATLPCDQDEWLKPYIGSRIRRSRTAAHSYYQSAADMFSMKTRYKKKRRALTRLLWRSFLANPATFVGLVLRTTENAGRRFLHRSKA